MAKVILLMCLTVVSVALGKRYCVDDADCSALGSLQCIKSSCSWGICGCPRGKVSRFLGSEKGFGCVKLAKVGQSCDPGSGRPCGAVDSECSSGVCVCPTGKESRAGGEACLDLLDVVASETCSQAIGDNVAIGDSCDSGLDWWDGYGSNPLSLLADHPLDMVPNVVTCSDGYHTELVNDFESLGRGTGFVGGKLPVCVATKVGEQCLSDVDCSAIREDNGGTWGLAGGKCVDNVCACNDDTDTVDITGLFCGPALAFGVTCATDNEHANSTAGVCDGTQGLRCGDPCDLDSIQVDAITRDLTCVCDPAYTTSGTSCSAREVGDSCFGDLNCKAISDTAVCKNGSCSDD